jgi:hypothetical protein
MKFCKQIEAIAYHPAGTIDVYVSGFWLSRLPRPNIRFYAVSLHKDFFVNESCEACGLLLD